MNQILCSTGALITSRNGRNHRLLEEARKAFDCDGFEFMMYEAWYDNYESITQDIITMNLPIVTFHVEKGIGELISRNEEGDHELALERFQINCRMASRMDANVLVLHLWGGRSSDREIETNIRMYRELRTLAESYGLLLTVENVVCNRQDPLTHMKELHEVYPDIAFTLDVRLGAFHGQLEEYFSEENVWLWQGAIRHVHISDFCGEPMDWVKLRQCLHPSEGNIDYEWLFAQLNRVGYDGNFTIESTSIAEDGSWHIDKMNKSIALLRGLLSTVG